MAIIGTVNDYGNRQWYAGIDGVNDNDVIIQTEDISKFDLFHVSCAAGVFDVQVHDGLQWLTNAHALVDLNATALDPVNQGAALTPYGFSGNWHKIRVLQKGATACTGSMLRCFRTP